MMTQLRPPVSLAVKPPVRFGKPITMTPALFSLKDPGRPLELDVSIGQKFAEDEIEWKNRRNDNLWTVFDTKLKGYARPLELNFLKHLQNWVEKKRVERKPIRILDVGIGSGRQWEGFLEKNPDVELVGTALTDSYVDSSMADRIRITYCQAKYLDDTFLTKFGMIVSRAGMHSEENNGIAAAYRLLEIGGELMVVGFKEFMPTREKLASHYPNSTILGVAEAEQWRAVHILKNG